MRWRCFVLVGVMVGSMVAAMPVRADVGFENEEIVAPSLQIFAVNGGYSGNNWDFVELENMTGGGVELAGWVVRYTRSSGTSDELVLYGTLVGEKLLLRYKNSPQKDGDFFYSFDVAAGGGKIELIYIGEVVDAVTWGTVGKNDGRYGIADYYPSFDVAIHAWVAPPEPEAEVVLPQCLDLVFSEIYSYFENDYDEQFVEIYNSTDEDIVLDGCVVQYKNKNYALYGVIVAEGYLEYKNADLKLTKNPTTSNVVELVDVDGRIVASAEWYSGQKKGVSWSFFGVDGEGREVWQLTYARTPGVENEWQEFRSCEAKKIINPQTGNCIKEYEEEPLPDCGPGRYRNPETNRCKSYAAIASILAPCAAGQYRNPETNRCKKVETASTLTPCQEGWERNPETNRCRLIRGNNGADYGVAPITFEDKSSFLAYGAMSAVITSGVLYIIFQFRREIVKPFRLAFAKIKI